ncbi:hypothetical protein ARMGADRAFT_579096 [Armillaria gallica]|uniref:Uncharacterized protein n=1 Tax=Armillaria gallica TaxID=47427 RepID=A0A2H3DWR4_ARMGA|nr:hypothetical protein ARMGADRAFT_579096 [Armillaria gallica]
MLLRELILASKVYTSVLKNIRHIVHGTLLNMTPSQKVTYRLTSSSLDIRPDSFDVILGCNSEIKPLP